MKKIFFAVAGALNILLLFVLGCDSNENGTSSTIDNSMSIEGRVIYYSLPSLSNPPSLQEVSGVFRIKLPGDSIEKLTPDGVRALTNVNSKGEFGVHFEDRFSRENKLAVFLYGNFYPAFLPFADSMTVYDYERKVTPFLISQSMGIVYVLNVKNKIASWQIIPNKVLIIAYPPSGKYRFVDPALFVQDELRQFPDVTSFMIYGNALCARSDGSEIYFSVVGLTDFPPQGIEKGAFVGCFVYDRNGIGSFRRIGSIKEIGTDSNFVCSFNESSGILLVRQSNKRYQALNVTDGRFTEFLLPSAPTNRNTARTKSHMALADEDAIKLYDVVSGSVVRTLATSDATMKITASTPVAISPDGDFIIFSALNQKDATGMTSLIVVVDRLGGYRKVIGMVRNRSGSTIAITDVP